MRPRSISTELVEFFAIAIQAILFTHDIYPAELFQRRRKYGIVVYTCQHPLVLNYLRSSLAQCRHWIKKGRLERITVAVLRPRDRHATRRFNLDIVCENGCDVLDADELAQLHVVFAAHVAKLLAHPAPLVPPSPVANKDTAARADVQDHYPSFKLFFYTTGVRVTNRWIAVDAPSEAKEIDESQLRLVPIKDPDMSCDHVQLRLIMEYRREQ